jgi:hypothetical protein
MIMKAVRNAALRTLGATMALGVLIGTTLVTPAVAAEPIRESDTTDAVAFSAVAGDRLLDINLMRSASSGTFADIALYEGPEGSSLGSGSGTSVWTDSTFAATVELRNDDADVIGTAEVTGSYAPAGAAETYVQKFKDGNARVVFEQSVTPLAVTELEVTLDGVPYVPGDVSGDHQTQSLFVSQPATLTGHSSQLSLGAYTYENADDFYADLAHGIDEVYLFLEYADSPLHASQQVDMSTGHWTGTFDLREEDGQAIGTVEATISLSDKGKTERFVERTHAGYAGYSYTPYSFTMIIDGPNGPATVTAEAAVLRYGIHTSPQG